MQLNQLRKIIRPNSIWEEKQWLTYIVFGLMEAEFRHKMRHLPQSSNVQGHWIIGKGTTILSFGR